MHLSVPYSTSQARKILTALNTRDVDDLTGQLNVAGQQHLPIDAGEQERLELLAEIARELRSSVEPFSGDMGRTCRRLLGHLAQPAPALSRFSPSAASSRSTRVATLLQ